MKTQHPYPVLTSFGKVSSFALTGLMLIVLSLLLASPGSLMAADPVLSSASSTPPAGKTQFGFIQYEKNQLEFADTAALDPFFEKLHALSQGKDTKIRIVHIGDSHIQGGSLSGRMRTQLQSRFENGNGGRGFLFPYTLAKTNNPVNYRIKSTGTWSGCRNVFEKKRCTDCGLGGLTASMTGQSGTFTVSFDTSRGLNYFSDKVVLYYPETSASGYAVTVQPPTGQVEKTVRDAATGCTVFFLSEAVDQVTIQIEKKSTIELPFVLQGMALENNDPGFVYSEIGVNGAKLNSYLECPDFFTQLSTLDPDLVIVSLGTNDAYYSTFQDSVFAKEYAAFMGLLTVATPDAGFVLTTPGDCKRNKKYPNKNNVAATRIVKSTAKQYDAAVWDLFSIMGGLGSIENWYLSGLSAKDRVHLNRTGYEVQADLLHNALVKAYKDYESAIVLPEPTPFWLKKLKEAVAFDNAEPMFFTSYLFWIFFTVFLGIFALVYKRLRWRNIYLLLISLFFYYKAGGLFFGLLLFSTVVDFAIGWGIHKSKLPGRKKAWLITSIVINLGLLCFFKYAYFFTDSFNALFGTQLETINAFAAISNSWFGTSFDLSQILLPVGVSFFTFQTISYSVDVFRGRIEPVRNIFDFAFYVSFFPQLVAGPIVRASEFIPQISKPYSVTKKDFSRALYLILTGLLKKIVISDFIAVNFVQRVFENPLDYSGFENLMGIYGYALQIYCDFSGYSDVAIGLALLLGFHLPLNFNSPYRAESITDFWRRWHISLSSWLKDYLYIPLGGNRKSSILTWAFVPIFIAFVTFLVPSPYNWIVGGVLSAAAIGLGIYAWNNKVFAKRVSSKLNLMITMFLGGLWHGAAIRFILWGLLHGVALAVHKAWSTHVHNRFFGNRKEPMWYRGLSLVITFHFVAFCWILFRAESMDIFSSMLHQIAFNFHMEMIPEFLMAYKWVFLLIAAGFILHFLPKKIKLLAQTGLGKVNMVGLSVIILALIVIMYQFKASDIQPFIYFQF